MTLLLTENPKSERTLVSWKEIAAFLNRAERTVKRWERDRGLPVHRVPGGERGGVYAYAAEIEAWLNSANEPGTIQLNESELSEGDQKIHHRGIYQCGCKRTDRD
jgi:phage terminase Nu1 subunit (DNA packaging protein)